MTNKIGLGRTIWILLLITTACTPVATATPTANYITTTPTALSRATTPTASATVSATATVSPTATPTQPPATATSTATPSPSPTATLTPTPCVPSMRVVGSWIAPTNAVVLRNSAFKIGWQIENDGGCSWPMGVRLVSLTADNWETSSLELPALSPTEQFDLELTPHAPTAWGSHQAAWQVQTKNGNPLGSVLSVTIQVPQPASVTGSVCPQPTDNVVAIITARLNTHSSNAATLNQWLQGCFPGSTAYSYSIAGSNDIIVTLHEQNTNQLLAFIDDGERFQNVFSQPTSGEARLLTVSDINSDGLVELVWQDQVCETDGCMPYPSIFQWKNNRFEDHLSDFSPHPGAGISLIDVLPEGSGLELIITYPGENSPKRDIYLSAGGRAYRFYTSE